MNGMPYVDGINGTEYNVLADASKVHVHEASSNTEINDPSILNLTRPHDV